MSASSPVVTATAPGKVLICGGYLVVEAPNVGLSIGVTARFRTSAEAVTLAPGAGPLDVEVVSPQFSATFNFRATWSEGANDAVSLEQTAGRESPFLYYGILTTLAYLRSVAPLGTGSLRLILQADNDFYSQRNFLESLGKPVTAATLRTVPPVNVLVGDVSKTGLGSSAALTTSFVACLCHAVARQQWWRDAAAATDAAALAAVTETETVHRLAQAGHSVAQGKIGSGFDVHTAVYGTNVYVRFPTSRIDALMADKQPKEFRGAVVRDVVSLAQEWVPRRPVTVPGLPPRVNLILADIHQGGSATPGMVSKVMAWRKAVAGQEGNLWDALARTNEAYLAGLLDMHRIASEEEGAYAAAAAACRAAPAAEWAGLAAASPAAAAFARLHSDAASVRGKLREAGVLAGVEIEPPALTPLLDATLALPGVAACGCPGAGGYDAIFALVVGGEEEMGAVEKFWEKFAGLNVCPLLVREDARGLVVE